MHRPNLTSTATLVVAAVAAPLSLALAQQSDVAVSPFVSFLPTAGASPLAGLAITLGGNGGFGLRGSAHVALENTNTSAFARANSYRPWGADADAILSLGSGYRRSIAPFVFAGIGTAGGENDGLNIRRNNWSYGAGAAIPLGSAIDIFGESRWRMSRYVLPTATGAPSPTNEFRFGLSFHVGNGGGGYHSKSAHKSRDRRSDTRSSLPTSVGRISSSARTSPSAARVIEAAEDYIGVPYRWGGTTPQSGFDASGFTQYVFARQGVRLPRTSSQQAQVGESIEADWRAVAPGDLVMFEEHGKVGHVAIYAGRNRIIHSSSSGGGVRYDDLSTLRGEWFVDHMVAARRVRPDSRGLLVDLARGFPEFGLELDPPDHAPRPRR